MEGDHPAPKIPGGKSMKALKRVDKETSFITFIHDSYMSLSAGVGNSSFQSMVLLKSEIKSPLFVGLDGHQQCQAALLKTCW